jgi:AcrR family transcriptional regulator
MCWHQLIPPPREADRWRAADRALARTELTRVIERAAEQLADVGPAALSVRAVARDLGMASSAVCRFFASRDEL